jgi:hypothetical protein
VTWDDRNAARGRVTPGRAHGRRPDRGHHRERRVGACLRTGTGTGTGAGTGTGTGTGTGAGIDPSTGQPALARQPGQHAIDAAAAVGSVQKQTVDSALSPPCSGRVSADGLFGGKPVGWHAVPASLDPGKANPAVALISGNGHYSQAARHPHGGLIPTLSPP